MGIDLAYFAAADDRAALTAERRHGGPLGWPVVTGRRRTGLFRSEDVVTELGPAFVGFAARGYEPVVTMATLEHLLTGRDVEVVMDDARHGAAPGGADEEPLEDQGVVTLTDSLRDALSGTDGARLTEIGAAWGRTDELQQAGWDDVTDTDHVAFLRQLRDLARQAAAAGHRLYCYISM